MDGIAAYRENVVTMQSRGRVIVMLYEGAIQFLRRAKKALAEKDFAAKGTCINKAAAIIEELDLALDAEGGGEIAQNLRQLYLFMRRHLNKAHASNDPRMLDEVISLLADLNEGFRAIAG